HFWHGGEHPEERNPSFLPFSTVQRAPKVRYTNFRRTERRIWVENLVRVEFLQQDLERKWRGAEFARRSGAASLGGDGSQIL
ncbi:hypothetical protein VIGAN_05127200, partial [Vigna angularis var. angularis]